MYKRRFMFCIILFVPIIALIISGCTQQVLQSFILQSAIEPKDTLFVYILNSGTTSQQCYLNDAYEYAETRKNQNVSITAFTNKSEMESRLQLELASGQGPDVIMADSVLGLDMMALAESGAFYDMTDIISGDTSFNSENYYLAVMKAGQLADRQYIIPLSFTLPAFVSTSSQLQELGVNIAEDSTLKVYEKILTYLKNTDEPQISAHGGYCDTIMALMLSAGLKPIVYETNAVTLDRAEDRMIMELGAELFSDWNRWMDLTQRSPNFWLETAKVPITYTNMFTSPFQLQLYYSAHAAQGTSDEVELFFMPDEAGQHHALVQEFAAVTANAANPELAWTFIKSIIDHTQTRDVNTALSLNRTVTRMYILGMTNESSSLGNGFVTQRMPQKYGDQLEAACDTIADASLYQMSPLTMIFTNSIIDYMKGTVTLDAMVDNIVNKVQLYVNE